MYYTPGHFFKKSATGCLVHHYSYRRLNLLKTILWINLLKTILWINLLKTILWINLLKTILWINLLKTILWINLLKTILWKKYTVFILCFHMGVPEHFFHILNSITWCERIAVVPLFGSTQNGYLSNHKVVCQCDFRPHV